MSKILMKDRNVRKSHKKLFGILGIAFVLLVALFYVTVAKSGHWLVNDSEFDHVKWAVILDGQTADLERNDFVADLLAQGKIDSVMVLGRRVFRDKSNADYYAEDFMSQGNFSKGSVFLVRHDDPSTISEASTIIPWIKRHKIDTVLLVTAAPATRRAVRIFTKLSGDSTVYLSADIHHHQYYADSWLFNRESRKNWLHEWAALANSVLDLWGADTLGTGDSSYEKMIRSMADEEMDEPVIDLQALLRQQNGDTGTSKDSSESKTQESKTQNAPDTTITDSTKAESAQAESSKSDSTKQARK